jgi:beta-N-acetylhexosaminidase
MPEMTHAGLPDSVPALLQQLSLEERVGQVIMGGFQAASADEATLAAVRDGSLGNIVLFARNFTGRAITAESNRALQAAARFPLLIAADQEGGIVTRIGPPAAVMPGAMALGATDDPTLAHQAATVLAREMRAVGVNVDLAPVADVNSNPANPVIGVRSFGEDPHRVAQFVTRFAAGLQAEGVAPCVKHFPGHGDTAVDSHLDLPVIQRDLRQLEAVELVPFRAAIAAGVPLVMTAHILCPALDPVFPSTLSRVILTDLLRERLGFQGVVITDDLEMDGIVKGRSTPEAALHALLAGADLVTISHHRALQAEAHALLCSAARSGELSEARLNEAVERVLRLKMWLAARAEVGDAGAVVGSDEHLASAQRVADASVTLVRDEHGWLPLPPGRLAVVEFGKSRITFAEDTHVRDSALAESLAASRAVEATNLAASCPAAEGEAAVSLARRADVIVVGTRSALLFAGQQAIVRALLALGKPTVIVSLRNPYDLLAFPDAPAFLTVYDDTPPSLNAVSRVLLGRLAARGTLPVSLPGLYPRGYGLRRVEDASR